MGPAGSSEVDHSVAAPAYALLVSIFWTTHQCVLTVQLPRGTPCSYCRAAAQGGPDDATLLVAPAVPPLHPSAIPCKIEVAKY
jgi:hypothetical protein